MNQYCSLLCTELFCTDSRDVCDTISRDFARRLEFDIHVNQLFFLK